MIVIGGTTRVHTHGVARRRMPRGGRRSRGLGGEGARLHVRACAVMSRAYVWCGVGVCPSEADL